MRVMMLKKNEKIIKLTFIQKSNNFSYFWAALNGLLVIDTNQIVGQNFYKRGQKKVVT